MVSCGHVAEHLGGAQSLCMFNQELLSDQTSMGDHSVIQGVTDIGCDQEVPSLLSAPLHQVNLKSPLVC